MHEKVHVIGMEKTVDKFSNLFLTELSWLFISKLVSLVEKVNVFWKIPNHKW